jgi:GT2 family glycosyltransferase
MDRLPDLKELLFSISKQIQNDLEVVFVGENSTKLIDEVERYARNLGIKGTFVMNSGQHGLAQGRNFAIPYCSSPIVGMVDDDVILPRHWTRSVIDTFEKDNGIIGMTGPAYPLWEEDVMDWLPEEFYWLISCTAWCDFSDPSNVRSAWGMNMAFKKESFRLAGGLLNASGFHKPMAEDLEYSLRIKRKTGKRISFNKDAYVWHRVHSYRFTWKYVRDRSRHIGTSRYMIKELYRTQMDRENNLFGRIIMNIPRRVLTHPKDSPRIVKLVSYVAFNIAVGYVTAQFQRNEEQRQFLHDAGLMMKSQVPL